MVAQEHLEKWLGANTKKFDEVYSLLLSEFRLIERGIRGKFQLKVNNVVIADDFGWFFGEADVYAHVLYPLFHSPFGVPATFSRVILEFRAELALERCLRDIFPRQAPLGINCPPNRIIDEVAFFGQIRRLSEPGVHHQIDLR
jgi:hypothetical protein